MMEGAEVKDGAMHARAPSSPRSSTRRALHCGVVGLAALSVGIVAVLSHSSTSNNAGVELLAPQRSVSRSAVLGDGMVDTAWSDVWSRKPAQYKAVSQELSSYDDIGSQTAVHPKMDASQAKAEDELAGYSKVTKSVAATTLTSTPRVSADPKSLSKIPATQWSTKQQLEDAAAHDKELHAYNNILSFSPKDTKPVPSKAQPAAAKPKGGSYNILDFPFPAYKAWYSSPTESKAAAPTAPVSAAVKKSEETEKSELNRYDVLNFPAAAQKLNALKAAVPAAAAQAKSVSNAALAAAAPSKHAAPAAAPSAKHAALAAAASVHAAKVAMAKRSASAVAAARRARAAESKEFAHVTPFTGLLQVWPFTSLLAASALEAQPSPSDSAILIQPPPADAHSPLARKWSQLWHLAQSVADLERRPTPAAAAPKKPAAAAVEGKGGERKAEQERVKAAMKQLRTEAKAEEKGKEEAKARAEEEEKHKCAACRAVWSEGALACVEECAGREGGRKLSHLEQEQLAINAGVAGVLAQYLGPDTGRGGREVLVEGFEPAVVQPDAERVPEWVAARREGEALQGRGLAGGKRREVVVGGEEVLSGAALHEGGEGMEAALRPWMARQRKVNEERVRAGAHVLGGFNAGPTVLAWKPHPGFAAPREARAHEDEKEEAATAAKEKALAEKKEAEKRKEAEKEAEEKRAEEEKKEARLSRDPVLRGLQEKAQRLRGELKAKRRMQQLRAGGKGARGAREKDEAVEWVLEHKKAELAMAEARARRRRPRSSVDRVGRELKRELQAEEGRLEAARAERKREAEDGRLVREEVREEALQEKHATLLATLRELRRKVREGQAAKAPEQMLAEVGKGGAGALADVQRLAAKAAALGEAVAGAHAGRGAEGEKKAREMEGKLQFVQRLLDGGAEQLRGAGGKAARERLEGLLGEAAAAAAGLHKARGGRRGIESLLREAKRELGAAGQGGGVVGAQAKAQALQRLVDGEEGRRSRLAGAIRGLGARKGKGGYALSEAGRLAAMKAALQRDEAALAHSADYLPALSARPGKRITLPAAPQSAEGGGGSGDGALRADVKALLGATKVADPKQYDAMLDAAIEKEAGSVARFSSAERFASKAIDRELQTADGTFAQAKERRAVAAEEADPAVAAAMRSAHRIEREMHIAFPHADARAAAAAARARAAAAKRAEEEREGKFIAGIGRVKKDGEGRETLSEELWKHHRVPVQQAEAEAVPALVRGGGEEAGRRRRQPKLAADGGLRAEEKGRVNGKEPSGWSVVGKEGHKALSEGKAVEGDMASGLGWALGGLTQDKKAAGGGTEGNSLWSYI